VHFNLGNYEDAILAYEKAVELEPHKPTRLVNLGFSYEAAGDLIKAITAIESALVIVPENTQYLGILADLLQKNGQFETTAAVLEKILQIEPTNQAVRDRLMKLRY
jgi:tetratricopeptide (TPR) repeat protein